LLQLIHNFFKEIKPTTGFYGINQLVGPEYLVEIEFTAVVSENNLSTKDFILLHKLSFIKVMNIENVTKILLASLKWILISVLIGITTGSASAFF
jgi:hypothetical protein